ncbi:MAG: glucosidase [Simkaniaceae bacterium]|nr:glucosidase [Simkaniaceae bacterium]
MGFKMTAEEARLKEKVQGIVPPWQMWGPYVAERQWGTVREDYSADGNSWEAFSYDDARSRVYRWGEDGIAGVSDRYEVLAFTHAFWNHNDPILKERLFGLTGPQGNHAEDVKEYFFYLDNTPTHSYMKYLYKYPHAAYPYQDLIDTNAKRSLKEREYELVDTGIFNEGRYFDIFIEYAKVTPTDMVVRIEACNRGPEDAVLDFLPQVMFRNTWVWDGQKHTTPEIRRGDNSHKYCSIVANDEGADVTPFLNFDYHLGATYFYGDPRGHLIFTNNETNTEKLYGEKCNHLYTKDAFHRHIIDGEDCINHQHKGTKAGFHYKDINVPAGGSEVIVMRISNHPLKDPLDDVEEWVNRRKEEADAFYESVHPENATKEEKRIQREALAGMLWGKQIYNFHVNRWLEGDDPQNPPPAGREKIRNSHWRHLVSKRILSMPDKWEYPWFAAWDLCFHTLALSLVDITFAKDQLWLLLFDQFQHPNGQVPAYEWEFSELNPPVQAWAVWRVYQMEYEKTGMKDRSFLQRCFHKMMINFVWWVNRVDSKGNNVFEGGFLGLDNITVIDRSEEIPGGGSLEQSDGTGWMGLFTLMMMRMSLELAKQDSDYESLAVKFFEHFVYIGAALEKSGNRKVQNWNEEDGFYYDVIAYPDGSHEQIFVRSLVGLIPLYAIDFISDDELIEFKEFSNSFDWFLKNRPHFVDSCLTRIDRGDKKGYMIALMKQDKMKRILEKAWDPAEFRSQYGLRSLSKYHEKHPYELFDKTVFYDPGECCITIKGGNSNWRGPIWFPTSYLFIETLNRLHEIIGDDMKIKVEGEATVDLKQMVTHYATCMVNIFKKDSHGKRPVHGDYDIFHQDPHWDHILFYEHFHGDTGRGLGASHQTGWTGLVANLIDKWICSHRR